MANQNGNPPAPSMLTTIDWKKENGTHLQIIERLANDLGKNFFERGYLHEEPLLEEVESIKDWLSEYVPDTLQQIYAASVNPASRGNWKDYCLLKRRERKEQELLGKLEEVISIVRRKVDEDLAWDNIYPRQKAEIEVKKLEQAVAKAKKYHDKVARALMQANTRLDDIKSSEGNAE